MDANDLKGRMYGDGAVERLAGARRANKTLRAKLAQATAALEMEQRRNKRLASRCREYDDVQSAEVQRSIDGIGYNDISMALGAWEGALERAATAAGYRGSWDNCINMADHIIAKLQEGADDNQPNPS